MKKIKFLKGMNAIFAFAAVALATTFTSCEKESFNVDVKPIDAQATISPIVLAVVDGLTKDVTGDAGTTITITPSATFKGNPTLAATEATVTASYGGMSLAVKVKVPELQAGQFASLTPTIILQKEDAETKIEVEHGDPTSVPDTWVKNFDNYDLYWYNLPSVTYIEKTGNKVENEKINTTDLSEIALINAFFSTLKDTYKEISKTTEKGEYKVFANSRTIFSVTYTIQSTQYKVVKKTAETKAGEVVLATGDYNNYTTSTLNVAQNKDIPDHGHSHGHGHGHGGDYNAGGGIVNPE